MSPYPVSSLFDILVLSSSVLQFSVLPEHDRSLPGWQASLQDGGQEHHLQQQILFTNCSV